LRCVEYQEKPFRQAKLLALEAPYGELVANFGIIAKRKTADESVTNAGSGTTLQDDDHLTFSIAAAEEWIADFFC